MSTMTGSGVFQFGTGIRFAEITDGLSNTLMVGEKHVPIDGFGVGWLDCSTYNGDYHTCSTRPVGLLLTPDRVQTPTTDRRASAWSFGSWHTSTVQFCFADGHVRGISPNIEPRTFLLLGQRDDGEAIPDY